jgi:hypothetical protein
METEEKVEMTPVFEGGLAAAKEVSTKLESAGIASELGTADGVEPGS